MPAALPTAGVDVLDTDAVRTLMAHAAPPPVLRPTVVAVILNPDRTGRTLAIVTDDEPMTAADVAEHVAAALVDQPGYVIAANAPAFDDLTELAR